MKEWREGGERKKERERERGTDDVNDAMYSGIVYMCIPPIKSQLCVRRSIIRFRTQNVATVLLRG